MKKENDILCNNKLIKYMFFTKINAYNIIYNVLIGTIWASI